MKILLTGSNGFLGRCIYESLYFNNKVFKLNTKNSDYNFNLFLDTIVFDKSFDLIIHSAGKAHSIPKTNIDKELFANINVKGTKKLLAALSQKFLPKYFLFISSVSVYGLNEGKNINESSPLLADDPYGKSKIEAEEIIKTWCEENNVICTILRLPLVVGVNPPGNLGAMIRGIKRGYYFNIAGGNAKKSMVLASDVAKFILKAAEAGGTYNLTDGVHSTFHDLSKVISAKLGKSFVPNLPSFAAIILAKFGDLLGLLGGSFPLNSNKLSKITSTLTFDDSKARLVFGWDPTSVLEGFKLREDAE
jgi:nucleoside-diphosphate-sugar epimerase